MGVDERILGELEAMGFAKALAAKALTSSGNSSIEDAINWIVDHENDTVADEPSLEPEILEKIDIETYLPFPISEQVRLRAQKLRNQAHKNRAVQEKMLEREREKERIQSGEEMLKAKRMAEERKRIIARKEEEKEEERQAREKVRQKLQQDKLERRAMLGLPREVSPPVNHDTESPQITQNLEPVGPAVLPVKHASAKDRMRESLRSLKRQNKHLVYQEDNTKTMRAFQTLLMCVQNVVKNPDEAKFKKIRISNPVFQDRVGRFEEGIEFLELCGFERVEGGNVLLLPQEKVDIGILKSAAIELHNALTNPFFGLLSG